MAEGEVVFVGHSEAEINAKLRELGAALQDIFFISTRGDRPGDWPDVCSHAFEIKVEK